jgi:hypothetical protein
MATDCHAEWDKPRLRYRTRFGDLGSFIRLTDESQMKPLLTASLGLTTASIVLLQILLIALAQAKKAPEEAEDLIRRLGSPEFQIREAATARLLQRRDALPALRAAAKSKNAEIASRARKILGSMDAAWALPELRTFAKQGKVDLLVEKLVATEKWGDEIAAWQVMADLASKICELEEKVYGKTCFPKEGLHPVGDLHRFLDDSEGKPFKLLTDSRRAGECGGMHFALRARAYTETPGASNCFFAISGEIRAPHLKWSVIFADGSVRTAGTHEAVVICDGDFIIQGTIDNSLIIARGDVIIDKPGEVLDSHIICSGKTSVSKGVGVTLRSKVKENDPNPLGFIKYFDPADIGIKVEKAENGVKVKEAPKDMAFGAAGLRAGDLLVALDGKEVKDPETFRRLLRPRVVQNEEIVFRLRREKETLDIKVQVKE